VFLISSEQHGEKGSFIDVTSEKGGPLAIQNEPLGIDQI
jgi:hypothetical protein